MELEHGMKGERDFLADLYPPLDANRQGWLPVSDGHRLYWEESGNPQGVPVLFLHGGPGAGCSPLHRRFFDPRHYRIALFDQRGCGRSLPNASIGQNTTPSLVADIEDLRRHLGIDRWLLFGGSWGSTLALAYGEAHPERCLGFILRGVFLFTRDEVDWFVNHMQRFFPEAGRAFREHLPDDERTDLLAAYYRRLTDPNPAVHLAAAQAWCSYEESCSRLLAEPCETRMSASALAMARIEAHYMVNAGFLAENQLLQNIHRLHGKPAAIVQGRYDVVCPILAADRLARAWPGASLQVVADAGHSAMEPGIRGALVAATDRFRHIAAR